MKQSPDQPPTDAIRPAGRMYWPVLAAPLLFLAAAVPVILSGNLSGRGAYDQLLFHEPMIRQFVREWPVFDFANYLSATTPGYHLILAAWAKFVDPSRAALQLIGSVFTVGLLASLSAACAARARHASQGAARMWRPDLEALACVLPAAASMYVLFPGIWLLPDNIAWWLVLTVVLISLRPWTTWSPILAGLALLGLVFTRQSHLWAAGPIWAAAWLSAGPFPSGRVSPAAAVALLLSNIPARAGRLAMAITASVPAFLVVLAFYQVWGGLVVPRYQAMYHGVSPAAAAFILGNLAIISGFFGGYLLPSLLDLWKRNRGVMLLAAVLGVMAAMIPATTYDYDHGRSSGLWNIVRVLPVIAGRTSVLLLVLAPAGAVAAAAWLAGLSFRERWVSLAALAGFIAAQSASPQLWQRYNEPLILVLVALWAARAIGRAPSPETPAGPLLRLASCVRIAGPVVLALMMGALSFRTIWTAEPVKPEESPQYVAPASP